MNQDYPFTNPDGVLFVARSIWMIPDGQWWWGDEAEQQNGPCTSAAEAAAQQLEYARHL